MRPERLIPGAAPLLALLLGACSEPAPPPPAVMDPPASPASSARGNLRFKGPERLSNDLAAALALPRDALCEELGLYPCADLVHNVALGGVEPYGTGLYEASGVTALTTPLVVERIVWSACAQRVAADLDRPGEAVIFRGLPLSGGRLASPDGDEVRGVIGLLTQRALQRDPYSDEVARYVRLARDIETAGAAEPARSWMLAACFAAFSSAEAVFY